MHTHLLDAGRSDAAHAMVIGGTGLALGTGLGLSIGAAMAWVSTKGAYAGGSYNPWGADAVATSGLVAVPWGTLALVLPGILAAGVLVALLSVRGETVLRPATM